MEGVELIRVGRRELSLNKKVSTIMHLHLHIRAIRH